MAYASGSNAGLEAPLASSDDWKVISLVGAVHAGSHFFQLIIPSLYVAFSAAFGLDFAKLGLLVSIFFIVSGVGQACSGFVVDRVGALPVLWFGQGCFVLAAILLGASTGYPMLVLAAALGGIGNAGFHPADFSILNRRVSAGRLGHAFSVHGLTGNLGWAATPVFITGISMVAGWRVAAFAAAGVLALILLASVVWRGVLGGQAAHATKQGEAAKAAGAAGAAAAAPAIAAAPQGALQTLMALLSSPALWGAFLFFALTSAALSAIQNYTLPILGSLYQVSAVTASSALSGFMIAAACGMAAGGFLANANPHTERVVAIAFIVAAGLLAGLATGMVPTVLAVPALAAAGFCSGAAAPSRDMLIRRVTPKAALGSVYGLVYSGMDAGAAIAPFIFGMMLDAGQTSGPWLGAGLAFIVAAVLANRIAGIARRREALAMA